MKMASEIVILKPLIEIPTGKTNKVGNSNMQSESMVRFEFWTDNFIRITLICYKIKQE